jgi:hypothetical protein
MSTILKALKKLEQDKETLEARGMSGMSATAAAGDNRPAGRAGISKRLLRAAVIGGVLVGVFGAAIYYYIRPSPSSRQAVRPSETARKTTRPRATTSAQRAMDRSESAAQHSKKTVQQVKPVPQRKQPPKRAPRSITAGSGAPSKPALPERVKSGDHPEQGTDPRSAPPPAAAKVPEVAAGPAETSTPAKPAQPAETRSGQSPPYATADRLTDNRLKIQAIVWSPIADERMAVINTRIVREGGSVEGFSVVEIRSDDVIVRESGRLYRVAFGKP